MTSALNQKMFISLQIVLLGVILFGAACPAQADQSVQFTSLAVSVVSDQKVEKDDQAAICNNIQEGFQSKNGIWGLVGFPKVTCHWGRSGRNASSDQKSLRLHLMFVKKQFRYMALASFSKTPLARGIVPGKDWQPLELRDPKIVSSVALGIFERLPFLGVVSSQALTSENNTFQTKVSEVGQLSKLPPPKDIVFYKLSYDLSKRLWRPSISVSATMTKKAASTSRSVLYWNMAEKVATAQDQTPEGGQAEENGDYYFVHHAKGPRGMSKSLRVALQEQRKQFEKEQEALLADAETSLKDQLLRYIPGGYVGLRYGLPVGESAVFKESTFFGAVAEVGTGVLDGFRLYVDIWPELTETYSSKEAAFGGQRILAGWAYSLNIDYIISKVSIVPTLGYWSFRADLPVEVPETADYEIVNFDAKNTLSLGGVLAIDRVSPYYILQGWVAKDFGINFQKSDEAVQVDSTRLGLDLLVHMPLWDAKKWGFTMSFLTFGLHEQVALQKVSLGGEVSSTIVEGIEYKKNYMGGGIAISW